MFSVNALIYGDLTCLALSLIMTALESETCRFRGVRNIDYMTDVSNFPLLNKNICRWLFHSSTMACIVASVVVPYCRPTVLKHASYTEDSVIFFSH